MSTAEQTATQLSELFQRFLRLQPHFATPEHIVCFQKQMDSLRDSPGSIEDYHFLFRIFIILADSQTPPTMGELSANLSVPLSTATRIVNWLVRANFVERIQDPNDRRLVRVQMSESGQQLYRLNVEYNRQRIRYLLEHFSSEEQQQLLKLSGKLLDVLLAESQQPN
ncbi:MAG: MarR family winged helix-turn-helix transcriptional regulator [Chloroflexota bacterium]